jgi:hypothetical protein
MANWETWLNEITTQVITLNKMQAYSNRTLLTETGAYSLDALVNENVPIVHPVKVINAAIIPVV